MTNKEKYIKSIDKLKADDYLKAKVLNKLQEKPQKSFYFKFANAAIIIIFVISCTFLIADNKDNLDNSIYKNQEIASMNSKIKSVENEETLKGILSSSKEDVIINSADSYFEINNEVMQAQAETRNQENMYSKTNVQVEGIDEADIVKTDGNYIYYSGIDNKVMIVDANLNKVSEIKLGEEDKAYGGIQEIYVNENKLIAITQKNHYSLYSTEVINPETDRDINVPQAKTEIKLYNIENKSNVIEERTIELDGNYISSRMLGKVVYVITNQTINMNSETLQPSYKDSLVGSTQKFVDYEDMYYIENENIKQYLNIAGFNINKNEEVNIQSFLGMGDTIYTNENNLYVTGTKYNYEEINDEYRFISTNNLNPKTQIYKFKLIDSKVEFKEFAEVEGRIINQFAMDETEGYFRIATTVSVNDTTSNNIYILDARLKEIGRLTNIAEGEKIYSVRYAENKLYMITYEQVDPLFVIDLSNPREPKILGELKVPGYSSYLHPFDENHLIGIGEETKVSENGNEETIGLKISLYDISDVNSPKEISKYIIEGDTVYTEALYNHKALLFIKESGILAFPISISTGPKSAIYGAEILSVSIEGGIQEKGRVVTDENGRDYKKSVDRIIYIGDNLYTISRASIIANNIITLEQTGRVDF